MNWEASPGEPLTTSTGVDDSTKASVIRVASVPASHVYVRHLAPQSGTDRRPGSGTASTPESGTDSIIRLDDPIPVDGRKVPGGWWPPVMLDPAWIRDHHHLFDLFHVHFGFDAIAPRVMEDIVHELRSHRVPLVYTVHDLRNPHQPEPEQHRALLDVLIPAADSLITLTPGAAAAVANHWGRECTVLPHPHVIELENFDLARPPTTGFTVGVHVKSLRPNMDPFPVLDTLCATIATLPGARLVVNVHDEIFDPENHWYAPQAANRLMEYARRPDVDVVVHPYFSDDELWKYLMSLTVSVLPYRFGTHSGWLEACYDLGTAVIAPSCGFYSEQQDCKVYGFDEQHFDAESLDRCVRELYSDEPVRLSVAMRTAQRRLSASAHREIYEKVLG